MKDKKGIPDRGYSIEDLEAILDEIPYEVWLKDKDGKHVYINERARTALGLKKEEIIGKTELEIRPETYWQKCIETDKQVKEEKKVVFYEDEFDINKKECYRVYKFPILDGEDNIKLTGVFAKETSYTKNVDNELTELFSNATTSERKEHIKSLSKVLDNISDICNSSSIDLFLVDENEENISLYVSSNKSAFLENSTIKIDYEKLCKEYNSKLQVTIDDKLNYEFKQNYNSKVNINDNSKVKILPLITPNDKLLGILYIYHEDIYNCDDTYDVFIQGALIRISNFLNTIDFREQLFEKVFKIEEQKKNLEEAITSEVMKVNFLQNMSHEFRTPINVILMISKLLLSYLEENIDLDKAKVINYVKNLRQNVYRILRLVNNILETSNIEEKYSSMDMDNYNIVSIVEDIILCVAKYIEHTNKSITFDTEEEEIILACKPNDIEKIILNLISNSLKFTEDNGNIEVDIKVNTEEEKVFVHIKNDGPSISKENAEYIFNRFSQIDENITRENEGSGIGLYLVKYLVEKHNGEIWLNTQVNSGVEFIFYIPIKTTNNKDYIKTHFVEEHSMIDKCRIEFSDVYCI